MQVHPPHARFVPPAEFQYIWSRTSQSVAREVTGNRCVFSRAPAVISRHRAKYQQPTREEEQSCQYRYSLVPWHDMWLQQDSTRAPRYMLFRRTSQSIRQLDLKLPVGPGPATRSNILRHPCCGCRRRTGCLDAMVKPNRELPQVGVLFMLGVPPHLS